MKGLIRRLDRYQREHLWLGFPVAVFKRFGEDRAGQLAALVAYYGFFSLFPLLLAVVTLTGLIVGDNPELQNRVLDAALAQFPVIGDEIRANLGRLEGTGLALVVGIGGALWSGLAGIKAAQNAMDKVWDVPVKRQPSFPVAILRAVLMLATLGMFLLLSTFLGGVAAGADTRSTAFQIVGVAGSFVLNFLVFCVAFRVLTVEDVSWGDVLPGAVGASILWSVLQTAGGYVIGQRLQSASETYGFFAVVIALLTWMYLGGQATLLAAEINVVRTKQLWPRALDPEDLTEADRRALKALAEAEERHEAQDVRVRFEEDGEETASGAEAFRRTALRERRETARQKRRGNRRLP
jgi:membrane protein